VFGRRISYLLLENNPTFPRGKPRQSSVNIFHKLTTISLSKHVKRVSELLKETSRFLFEGFQQGSFLYKLLFLCLYHRDICFIHCLVKMGIFHTVKKYKFL
jgi:hypothetical protein